MSIDAYMVFIPYTGKAIEAESQVDVASFGKDTLLSDVKGKFEAGKIFEIESYSFGVDQTLNIGSQSTGAGAGKVAFQPFSIQRRVDKASPVFFQMCCSGTPFQSVYLAIRKSSGGDSTGQTFLRYDFKLVAVSTMAWSQSDESPFETITFEYGGLQIRYAQQKPDGTMSPAVTGGWNRVKNVSDVSLDPIK